MAKALDLPDDVMNMLSAADKAKGFPAGTMYSVLQQETGGNVSKYLQDPAKYHYGLNKQGRRVAKHTGKVSTAFGPFGILESTGRDPGYGVAPLKDKTLGEQIRFAADYLGARVKRAGGLMQGLAGYGEGKKYAEQVVNRIGGSLRNTTDGMKTQFAGSRKRREARELEAVLAQAPTTNGPMASEMAPGARFRDREDPVMAGSPEMEQLAMVNPEAMFANPAYPEAGPVVSMNQPQMDNRNAWQAFMANMPQDIQVSDLDYANDRGGQTVRPQDYSNAMAMNMQPDLAPFDPRRRRPG